MLGAYKKKKYVEKWNVNINYCCCWSNLALKHIFAVNSRYLGPKSMAMKFLMIDLDDVVRYDAMFSDKDASVYLSTFRSQQALVRNDRWHRDAKRMQVSFSCNSFKNDENDDVVLLLYFWRFNCCIVAIDLAIIPCWKCCRFFNKYSSNSWVSVFDKIVEIGIHSSWWNWNENHVFSTFVLKNYAIVLVKRF